MSSRLHRVSASSRSPLGQRHHDRDLLPRRWRHRRARAEGSNPRSLRWPSPGAPRRRPFGSLWPLASLPTTSKRCAGSTSRTGGTFPRHRLGNIPGRPRRNPRRCLGKARWMAWPGVLPLPWSHYVLLLRREQRERPRVLRDRGAARRLDDPAARAADRDAVLRAHRPLEEQGGDARARARGGGPTDAVSPEEELKDPVRPRVPRSAGRVLGVGARGRAHPAARALPPRARRRLHVRRAPAASARRRRVVPRRSALLPPRAPLPRRDRSEARRVHARRRRADAPLPELRARALDARPARTRPSGSILCAEKERSGRALRARRGCRTRSSPPSTGRSCRARRCSSTKSPTPARSSKRARR